MPAPDPAPALAAEPAGGPTPDPELERRVREYPPERVAALRDVPAADVHRAARPLAEAERPLNEPPLVLLPGRTLCHFHTRSKAGRVPRLDAPAPTVTASAPRATAGPARAAGGRP